VLAKEGRQPGSAAAPQPLLESDRLFESPVRQPLGPGGCVAKGKRGVLGADNEHDVAEVDDDLRLAGSGEGSGGVDL